MWSPSWPMTPPACLWWSHHVSCIGLHSMVPGSMLSVLSFVWIPVHVCSLDRLEHHLGIDTIHTAWNRGTDQSAILTASSSSCRPHVKIGKESQPLQCEPDSDSSHTAVIFLVDWTSMCWCQLQCMACSTHWIPVLTQTAQCTCDLIHVGSNWPVNQHLVDSRMHHHWREFCPRNCVWPQLMPRRHKVQATTNVWS